MIVPSPFENLCGPGKPLHAEPPDAAEFEGLGRSGLARLRMRASRRWRSKAASILAIGRRALCLAAFRRHGYRSGNRYIVFQLLLPLRRGPEVWRVLAKCHDVRNKGEYGVLDGRHGRARRARGRFEPPLAPAERAMAALEGWILGCGERRPSRRCSQHSFICSKIRYMPSLAH